VILLPGYVEVRDKGVLKKKIGTNNRSFDDVCSDLETYFREVGKKLPPAVVKETLQKIGVPQVKMIISDVQKLEPSGTPTEIEESSARTSARKKIRRKSAATQVKRDAKASVPETAGTKVGGVISGLEYRDVEEALSVVESLSDSFLASKPRGQSGATHEKGRIRIDVEGAEEIVGAPRMRPAMREPVTSEMGRTPITEVRLSSMAETSARPEAAQLPSRGQKSQVTVKALILGEESVGKSSLIQKAGLKPLEATDEGDKRPYISEKLIELENHRVRLQVWSFDIASGSRLTRKTFYEDTGVVIIVYSSSDRWSFESIDFWLKESTAASGLRPPFVIVGNKSDLRASAPLVEREGPVSQEEGLKLAQEIAGKLGSAQKLRPVAFIETSCLTGQGVEDVFRTAAELFVKSSSQTKP